MGTQYTQIAERDRRVSRLEEKVRSSAHGPIEGKEIRAIRFRRFHLDLRARCLLRDGRPIEIGSRAFDLLTVLAMSAGTVVSGAEITRHVWPSTVVEEGNLRFQVMSLRKTLGSDGDLVKTVPGRGYLFAAEVIADGLEANVGGEAAQLTVTPVAPNRAVERSTAAARTPPRATGKRTIVIIDDDSDTRVALDSLLRSAGFDVESYDSAEAFLRAPRESSADCILLDMWLAGRSGLELQMDLAAADIHAPVIFISGYADVHACVRAMKAGAFEFLTKPVRHQELLSAVHSAVARIME